MQLTDKEYIKELEALVCFLASCYESCKDEYQGKHFKTCSVDNPNRRDLTKQEEDELSRFPQIQGTPNIFAVSRMSKLDKKPTIPMREFEKRILGK